MNRWHASPDVPLDLLVLAQLVTSGPLGQDPRELAERCGVVGLVRPVEAALERLRALGLAQRDSEEAGIPTDVPPLLLQAVEAALGQGEAYALADPEVRSRPDPLTLARRLWRRAGGSGMMPGMDKLISVSYANLRALVDATSPAACEGILAGIMSAQTPTASLGVPTDPTPPPPPPSAVHQAYTNGSTTGWLRGYMDGMVTMTLEDGAEYRTTLSAWRAKWRPLDV
jgi:hypothetical protein